MSTPVPEKVPPSAWLSLLAVALGVMVAQLDGSVVAAANPVIAADLHAGPGGIQWVTTGYLLVFAGLVVPAGKVADKFGRKKVFLIGVGGFSLASVLCGFSGSIEMLIGARLLQAACAALLGPAGLAVLRAVFPAGKLSLAMGVFGSISAVSMAGGPIVGGLLVEYASWPWVFFVNLPVGILGVTVGALVIRESTQREPQRFDVQGAIALILAVAATVWAITNAPTQGWVSAKTLGFLGAGLLLFAVFVFIEHRREHPMMSLELFRDRTFSAGSVLTLLVVFMLNAIIFYLMFFLQGVQGKTPILASVALLPLTAVFAIASPLAGWVLGRLRLRITLLCGMLLIAGAYALLLRIGVDSGSGTLAAPMVVTGLGIGLVMVGAMQAVVGSAPVDKAGVASGMQQSMQQLGATFGVAVFGSILAAVIGSRFGSSLTGKAAQFAGNPAITEQIPLGFGPDAQQGLRNMLGREGLSGDRLERISTSVTDAAHQTFVEGIHTVYLVCIGISVLAALLTLLVREPETGSAETGTGEVVRASVGS
ncbi:MFS transporter [Sciscionella marina]|uniref:MFS transporter n=1 Tax=Sciscionella marina TaxID=508770 RepID=UPI0012F62180|nr:MFS transporter [Sciscionella marina]